MTSTANEPSGSLNLGVALDGVGWHPGAWFVDRSEPTDPVEAKHWTGLAAIAEHGLLDFITIDDSLAPPGRSVLGSPEPAHVRPRLDANLIAARVAPTTQHIGLIPTVTTTHTEPLHVSTAIATLDYTSRGRAGWQPRVSATELEARHFGRRTVVDPTAAELAGESLSPALADLFDEAADVVEVVRALWDSWEDDAEIRDVDTRRFIDRDKLHYVNFEGKHFSVRGPSITPRPPQGQPVVAALGHAPIPYRFAARQADLLFITPPLHDGPGPILRTVDQALADAGRTEWPLHTYADLVVVLDTPTSSAADRLAELDAAADSPFITDAAVFVGSAQQLADLLETWSRDGVAGFRLRPAVLPDDLRAIADDLVPELQRRGRFRTEYPAGSLRELLGLTAQVPNRFAAI